MGLGRSSKQTDWALLRTKERFCSCGVISWRGDWRDEGVITLSVEVVVAAIFAGDWIAIGLFEAGEEKIYSKNISRLLYEVFVEH